MSCKTIAQDIDAAITVNSVALTDRFVFTQNGTAYGVSFSGMIASMGVTGTITSLGTSPTATSILDVPSAGDNKIRTVEGSNGVITAVDAYGGVSIKTNFANGSGNSLIQSLTPAQLLFKGLVAGTNVSIVDGGTSLTISAATQPYLAKYVRVTSASDLASIDSSVVYVPDGMINMGATTINVPAGGINIVGLANSVSGLYSTSDSYTMFSGGAAGDVRLNALNISTSGANSKVFDLTGNSGIESLEATDLVFENCTSLGEVDTFRQLFFDTIAYFGGEPSITLSGNWAGGVVFNDVLVRGLSAGMIDPIFKEGTALSIQSRFRTNTNCDLPALAAFCDFYPSDFVSDVSFEISAANITRGGVTNPSDANITPNITHTSVKSKWTGNKGIKNTKEGGSLTVSATSATTFALTNTYYDVSGTFSIANNQHFDNPSIGRIRKTTVGFTGYTVIVNAECSGGSGDVIGLRVMKYDASAASASEVSAQAKLVNNYAGGGTDRAQFNFSALVELDKDDYIYLQARNQTDTTPVTFLVTSGMVIF